MLCWQCIYILHFSGKRPHVKKGVNIFKQHWSPLEFECRFFSFLPFHLEI
jgi:hypothetical protein